MKKTVLFLAVLFVAFGVSAQRPMHQKREHHPEVTQLVKDLSAKQKQQIEALTAESRKKVDAIRKEQQVLRDSIQTFIDSEGDHTRQLNPLFEREAKLRVQASREMYATKVAIDRILTKEQRDELRCQMAQHRNQRDGGRLRSEEPRELKNKRPQRSRP